MGLTTALGIAGVGASLFASSKASKASKQAANTQAQSGQQAMNLQRDLYNQSMAQDRDMFDQSMAAFEPYRQAGMEGMTSLKGLLNYPEFNFQQEPGYQFRLNEGNKAISRATASGRLPGGGASLKALTRFGQDYASGEYGNAFNRYQTGFGNRFNVASNLAGIGGDSLGAMGNLRQNYGTSANNLRQNFGQSMSDGITGIGNAQAAGQVGSANAWTQGMQNIGNQAMDAYTLRMMNQQPQNTLSYVDMSTLPRRR